VIRSLCASGLGLGALAAKSSVGADSKVAHTEHLVLRRMMKHAFHEARAIQRALSVMWSRAACQGKVCRLGPHRMTARVVISGVNFRGARGVENSFPAIIFLSICGAG